MKPEQTLGRKFLPTLLSVSSLFCFPSLSSTPCCKQLYQVLLRKGPSVAFKKTSALRRSFFVEICYTMKNVRMASSLEKFIGQSLNGATKLAWFGFSADPPTLAHRMIVDAVLGSGLVEKVIVFAAGRLPYKTFHASDWQRTDMVELWKSAAEFGDEVIMSRFDLLRDTAMNWYDLWNTLQERSGKLRHFLVVGSDQYQEIPRSWTRGKE